MADTEEILINVLLPDGQSLLTTTIGLGADDASTTIARLIRTLLSEANNNDVLLRVFGSHFSPTAVQAQDNCDDVQDDGSVWYVDSTGMPWAMQAIAATEPNYEWQSEELDALGDGILPLNTLVLDHLLGKSGTDTSGFIGGQSIGRKSIFSDFELSKHLHAPRIRLVCGAPGLVVRLRFAHIPEIYDAWQGRIWFLPAARDDHYGATGDATRAIDLVEAVCEELGLRRVILRGSKSAKVEYAIADVHTEQISMPPPPPLPSQLCLPDHIATLPGPPEAYPRLYFTLSAAWLNKLGTVALGFTRYARRGASESAEDVPSADFKASAVDGTNSTGTVKKRTSAAPAAETKTGQMDASTLLNSISERDLASLTLSPSEDVDESAEDQGTVKGNNPTDASPKAAKKPLQTSPSTTRLSKLFEGWLGPAEAVTKSPKETRTRERPISVASRHLPTETQSEVNITTNGSDADDDLESRFEFLMRDLAIKEESRGAMRALPLEQKKYLLAQNEATTSQKREVRTASADDHAAPDTWSRASQAFGWSRRFSISNLAGWSGSDDVGRHTVRGSNASARRESEDDPGSIRETVFDTGSDDALRSQPTGGTLWSKWWGSGTAVQDSMPTSHDSIPACCQEIKSGRLSRKNLVKTLINLRVNLSSAKIDLIADFIHDGGLSMLEDLLADEASTLVLAPDGDFVERKEMSDVIMSEMVKCLRSLMSIEIGLEAVLRRPPLLKSIAMTVRSPLFKLRSQSVDLLSACCVMQSGNGHELVCDAFTQLQIAFQSESRFVDLVESITLDQDIHLDDETDEAALWEYRASALVLVNALIGTPDSLESRLELRDEFKQAGLKEMLVSLKYTEPPDAILTQLEAYSQARLSDIELLQEREADSDQESHQIGKDAKILTIDLSPDAVANVEAIVQNCAQLDQAAITPEAAEKARRLMASFTARICATGNIDDDWATAVAAFLVDVQDVVGKHVMIKSDRVGDTSTVPSSFVEELESLRAQVEQLSDEKRSIKAQLNDHIARTNAFYSLPLKLGHTKSGSDHSGKGKKIRDDHGKTTESVESDEEIGPHGGIVQRLVSKEKEILQLKAELERLSIGTNVEHQQDDEKDKRDRLERKRQWTNLMEEIAALKQTIADKDADVANKQKEIKYLKRSMEAVHARFKPSANASPQTKIREIEEASAVKECDQNGTTDAKDKVSADAPYADAMAEEAIREISKRDDEIANLRGDVAKLQEQVIRLSDDLKNSETLAAEAKKEIDNLRTSIQDAPEPHPTDHLSQNAASPPAPPAPPPPPAPPSTPALASPAAAKTVSDGANDTTTGPPPPPPPPPMPTKSVMAHISSRGTAPPPAPSPAPLGVPGPPPPPGMLSKSGLHGTRNSLLSAPSMLPFAVPEKKRKPFFWTKLPTHGVGKTVWSSLPEDKADVSLDEFDNLFAIANVNRGSRLNVKAPAPKEKKLTTLLEMQRSQNIAILLSRIRLTFPQVRKALLEGDGASLTLDNLKAIHGCLPTIDEVDTITAYTGDFATLSKADQFFKEMIGIPKLVQRVECMIFMRKFELDLEELRPDISTLQKATHELRQNTRFPIILKRVLMLGNILNSKTFRGEARGFNLTDLAKLKDTRAAVSAEQVRNISTPTLLHYLVRVLNREDESLVGFLDECEHVEAASRLNLQSISASMNAISRGLSEVEVEVEALQKMRIALQGDRFIPLGRSFIKMATPRVQAMQKALQEAVDSSAEMVRYFGDEERVSKPEEVFGIIGSFGQSLMRAEVEVREKEMRQKADASKQKDLSQGNRANGSPVVNDTLLKALQEATIRRRVPSESSDSSDEADPPPPKPPEVAVDNDDETDGQHSRASSSSTVKGSEVDGLPSTSGTLRDLRNFDWSGASHSPPGVPPPSSPSATLRKTLASLDMLTGTVRKSRYSMAASTLRNVSEDDEGEPQSGLPRGEGRSTYATMGRRTVGRVAAAAQHRDAAAAAHMAAGEPGSTIMGARSRLDEALKDLHAGQGANGTMRKSMRHKAAGDGSRRPLSRIFLAS